MRRVVVVLALLALALPMAAWADGLEIVNQNGEIAISSGGIGFSTITSQGSHLTQFGDVYAAPGHSLGSVSYSTGVLLTGSIAGGGTFSSTGSSFDVVGQGQWAKQLTGQKGKVTLFSGSFVGPIDWTVTGTGKPLTFVLSGEVQGTLWNGRFVSGTTSQNIYTYGQQLNQGIGHIKIGSTQLSVPEPGTLGLLGTGLVGIAGMFRRKRVAQ